MTVTLKDVAKRAGVSIPTVSLIINGRDMPFKESTRAAVLEAVESLNYRPDSMARRNANGSNRRDAIALLLRSESLSRLANSPVYEFICGVNDVLMEHNQFLVMMKLHQLQPVEVTDKPAAVSRPPRVIAERFVDGLIVETGLPPEMELAVARYRIPTVWLNTNHHNPSDCVYPDEVHAGRLITEHMISLGHRNIAFVAPAGYRNPDAPFSVVDRQLGYEQAMSGHGLAVQVTHEDTPGSTELGEDLVRMLDRRNPAPVTAIVTYDLGQTLKLRWQVQQVGLTCPKDVSIAAAENLHYLRRTWPDLAGVSCDRYKMGSEAANMMLTKITNDGQPQPSIVYKGELIPGGTATAPPLLPASGANAVSPAPTETSKPPVRKTKPRAKARS
jgi:LacI family transcriptional regulator